MSVIPMHFWTPDVYEGAPTAVTAFLSVVSKGAGFALAIRFLGGLAASISAVEPGSSQAGFWAGLEWPVMVAIVSVLTMTLGNLAALWQTNLKRLMAYSSIAHAGYLAMGLALLRPGTGSTGMDQVAFYLLAYLTMNFGVFSVLILIENRSGSVDIGACSGLGKRSPLLALALTVFLFSLIGVPPTAGFLGKFQLFMGVVEVGDRLREAGDPAWWPYYALVIAAVLNTAVSAYYYLRVVKTMYFEDAAEAPPVVESAAERGSLLAGGLVVAVMLILTFYLCFAGDGLLSATMKLSMHVGPLK
jgi:NADH-quinone oxidoreductase subunit N